MLIKNGSLKKIIDQLNDNTPQELKDIWLDNLNLFIKKQRSLNFVVELANQLFTDISIGNPKVDDIFFASLEYFVELIKIPKNDVKKINSNIKEMIKLLNNKNARIEGFNNIWKSKK